MDQILKSEENSLMQKQFQKVFGTDATGDGIAKAIGAFERTINSGNAPYDQFEAGDKKALKGARELDRFPEISSPVRGVQQASAYSITGHCRVKIDGAVHGLQRVEALGELALLLVQPGAVGRERHGLDPSSANTAAQQILHGILFP
ncbi:hypothetical protein IIB49_00400 [Patescibacteria group bacterium]|nr:hypothetical protein [Patescibacteria group bacterium]